MMGLVPFETDILILTQSSYATGFEIKVSKADLLADLKKKQYTKFKNSGQHLQELYYAKKFKYFYYAVPKHLEETALDMIHEFIGLYVYEHFDDKVPTFKCVKEPKKLKSEPWTDRNVNEVLRLGCMRINTLKCALKQQIDLANYYKTEIRIKFQEFKSMSNNKKERKTAEYYCQVAKTGHEGLIDIIQQAMRQSYNDALEDAIDKLPTLMLYDKQRCKNEILKLKK